MEFDLSALTYQDFEQVVAALLVQSGYKITAQAKIGDRAPDFDVIAPTGERVIVNVKHYRQPVPRAIVLQMLGEIALYRVQSPGVKGLIVISGIFTADARRTVESHGELEAWTGSDILDRLGDHPTIVAAVRNSIGASQSLSALSMLTTPPKSIQSLSYQYSRRLKNINSGREHWREFELWCTEILADIFKPDLGPPDRHIRTDDGLDIMDAIFPIRAAAPPWSLVRAEFATRFIVAEYKNFVEPISQRQVESISQYLWALAKRQFGILVSRVPPSDSALAQRRRAWLEHNKMIVFLSSSDLLDMLKMRESGDSPFELIDEQLEDFLRKLSP